MAEIIFNQINSGIPKLKTLEFGDVIFTDNAVIQTVPDDGMFIWIVPGAGNSIVRFKGPVRSVGITDVAGTNKPIGADEVSESGIAMNTLYSIGDPQNTGAVGDFRYRIRQSEILGVGNLELTLFDAGGGENYAVFVTREA